MLNLKHELWKNRIVPSAFLDTIIWPWYSSHLEYIFMGLSAYDKKDENTIYLVHLHVCWDSLGITLTF